jgi:hypothetical protein
MQYPLDAKKNSAALGPLQKVSMPPATAAGHLDNVRFACANESQE